MESRKTYRNVTLLAGLLAPTLAFAHTSISNGGEARTVAPGDAAGAPLLDGAAIDVTLCPADAAGMTNRCGDVLGYALVETRSDLSHFRFVEQSKQHFQVFIDAPSCEYARHAPEMEIRRYEGRPFAVIQRVDCLAPPRAKHTARARPQVTDVYFVVRGLVGFESLSIDIPVGKPTRRALAIAEGKAQGRADEFLYARWPALQTAMQAEQNRAIEAAFQRAVEAQRQARKAQQAAETDGDEGVEAPEANAPVEAADDSIVVTIDVGS